MKNIFLAFGLFFLPAMASAQSTTDVEIAAETQLTIVSSLAWEAMETISRHHVDPPLRNQMILDGISSLVPNHKKSLYEEIQKVESKEDFKRVLTKAFALSDSKIEEETNVVPIVNSFIQRVPGAPQLVTTYQARINKQLSENRYVGVGIALQKIDAYTLISVAFRGGPAHDAGVVQGDQIVAVDGESMKDKSIGDVVMALRGPKDSKVEMVVRQPQKESRKYEMTRGVVPIPSVKGMAEKGKVDWEFAIPGQPEIGYLEITDITGSTAAELMSAARQIERLGFKGLVLDFRNCFRAEVHHMRMVADTLISGNSLGNWIDAQGKKTAMKLRKMNQLQDLPLKIIASPAQSNEVKFLIQALVQRRKASILGLLNPAPTRIRGKIELPSGTATLENLYIGTANLSAEGNMKSQSGSARPNSGMDRFRTGAKKVDEMIRSAAKSLANG